MLWMQGTGETYIKGIKGAVKITVSKAAQRATAKYKKENYDNVSIMLPKGTKDKIKETGESVNSFINKAVAEKFERDEK